VKRVGLVLIAFIEFPNYSSRTSLTLRKEKCCNLLKNFQNVKLLFGWPYLTREGATLESAIEEA
jgi:hypothetical protein